MIKFQYSCNLMSQAILNHSPNFAYLFTQEAYQNFYLPPEDEVVREISADRSPRLQYFSTIKEHMATKPSY